MLIDRFRIVKLEDLWFLKIKGKRISMKDNCYKFYSFVLAIISVSGGEIEAFASYVATTPRYTVNGSWTVKNGTTVVSQVPGPYYIKEMLF